MIRPATVDDIEELSLLAAEFHGEAKMPCSYNSEVWKLNWTTLISMGMAYVLVEEAFGKIVGAIGVIISPDLNDGKSSADEAFWFQSKTHRGSGFRLLREMEKRLPHFGVSRFYMVHLHSLNDRLGGIYERMGYSKVETRYVKEI